MKKLWEPFGSCLLNSTANPAQFGGNWLNWLCYLAGKSSTAPRIFFSLFYNSFIYFFKYETIETHACAFLALIILGVGINYFDRAIFANLSRSWKSII